MESFLFFTWDKILSCSRISGMCSFLLDTGLGGLSLTSKEFLILGLDQGAIKNSDQSFI